MTIASKHIVADGHDTSVTKNPEWQRWREEHERVRQESIDNFAGPGNSLETARMGAQRAVERQMARWEAENPEPPRDLRAVAPVLDHPRWSSNSHRVDNAIGGQDRPVLVEVVKPIKEKPKSKPLPVIRPGEASMWLDTVPDNIEVPEWGLRLPAHPTAPSLVYGATGSGKSWLMLGMAAQLAEADIRTAVIATEGRHTWAKRMDRYPADRQPFVIPDRLAIADMVTQAARLFDREKIGVVIIDTLRPLVSGMSTSENDADAVDKVLGHLRRSVRGRALIVVHHSGKDPSRKARGSSSFQDQAGAIFHVKADPDGLAYITPEKWRDGPLEDQPRLRISFAEDGTIQARAATAPEGRGENTRSERADRMQLLIEWFRDHDTTLTAALAADMLTCGKSTAAGYLNRLHREGVLTVETGPRGLKFYRLSDRPTEQNPRELFS